MSTSSLDFSSPLPAQRRLEFGETSEMPLSPYEATSSTASQTFESQNDFFLAAFQGDFSDFESPQSHFSDDWDSPLSQEVAASAKKALFANDTESEIRQPLFRGEGRDFDSAPFKPMFTPFFNETGDPKEPCRYLPKSTLERKPLFLQNAIAVQRESEFLWQGKKIQIEIQNNLMNGQFNIFATICPGQDQLFDGIDNCNIALKTFRDHCIMVRAGSDKLQNEASRNVLEQYNQLRAANIPVSEIYNREEASNGCGFFLVENVPHPFEIWDLGTPLKSVLEDDSFLLLEQLQDIFYSAYDANIIPDLKPNNLRIREDGVLTIIDLRENAIKPKLKDSMFKQMLKTFNCKEGDEIYNFLNPMNRKYTT